MIMLKKKNINDEDGHKIGTNFFINEFEKKYE